MDVFYQVQRESVQLVWTSANLINETVSRNPEIAKWLPQSDSMQSTVTSVIEKGIAIGIETFDFMQTILWTFEWMFTFQILTDRV